MPIDNHNEAEDDTTGNTGDANFDTKASAGIQL